MRDPEFKRTMFEVAKGHERIARRLDALMPGGAMSGAPLPNRDGAAR
jgi:hypothetical protein